MIRRSRPRQQRAPIRRSRPCRVLLRATVALGGLAPATLAPSPASATAAAATAVTPATVLEVGGAVRRSAAYTRAELAALPPERLRIETPDGRTSPAVGVSLDRLVTIAGPVLPHARNAVLDATVTVAGTHRAMRTFALGELDPRFGDHDAVVVLRVAGRALPSPALYVPGDTNSRRDLPSIDDVTVGVIGAGVFPPPPGGLVVQRGTLAFAVTARHLAALPAETRKVTVGTGCGARTETETGPSLAAVLRAGDGQTTATTWVDAVSSGGTSAIVTPAEATSGGRPLIVSLTEDGVALPSPRLVADGDVRDGRDVSDLADLDIGQGDGLGVEP